MLLRHNVHAFNGLRCRKRICVHVSLSRNSLIVKASSGEKHVVIVGGTGRVGSATADVILKTFPNVKVSVASRNEASYEAACVRRPQLKSAKFCAVDINSQNAVESLLSNADLVIHAAGPFQRSENHNVLEASIRQGVPYLDVSDDTAYSERSKTYFDKARNANVPAIISGGIYPGTSNVMAAHIVSISRGEYDDKWKFKTPEQGEGVQPTWLKYSYYTAGSGGAGRTILETSFLLAGEDVVVYKDGQRLLQSPVSNRREVDFGPGVGRKGIYLFNLPEVESSHKILGIPSVSARFGTDPFFWNWAMWLTARIVPRDLLNSRSFAAKLAQLADPFVRIVDKAAGETVAMRVEVDFEGGKNASGIFVHRKLSDAMGYSIAGFAKCILEGQTQPGIWYPEEKEALQDRRGFFALASTGCIRFVLNRPAWALESEVQQIGGLIYW